MLPINGQPLLGHLVKWLRSHNICEIAVNLHYRPQTIVDYLGDGLLFDVHITYSHEDAILGTAGAARRLTSFWGGQPFVVVYGDVLTDLDLTALLDAHLSHRQANPRSAITMALYSVSNPTEVGLVEMDSNRRITRFVEKPSPDEVFTDLANAGIFVAEANILELIPQDTFFDFGHDLFPLLLAADIPMHGWVAPAGTRVLDIGTPERYAMAEREWSI
jgi:NDP-sugar pyrophosphorylase family protein